MLKKALLCSIIASTVLLSLNASANNNNNMVAKYSGFNLENETKIFSAKAPELDPKVLHLALTAYTNAINSGIHPKQLLTIIDYHQPNYKKRLWVLDLQKHKVLYNTYVAHGQKSGDVYANYFSNQFGTHASSIGLFLTQNTYFGSKGLSLRLNGLDKGYNDNALRRAIVIHGAWYVNPKYASQYGRIGRSWGCPSVTPALAKPIINTIKDGSLVFAYAPNFSWLHHSKYLTRYA